MSLLFLGKLPDPLINKNTLLRYDPGVTGHFITGHFITAILQRGHFITRTLYQADSLPHGHFITRPLENYDTLSQDTLSQDLASSSYLQVLQNK